MKRNVTGAFLLLANYAGKCWHYFFFTLWTQPLFVTAPTFCAYLGIWVSLWNLPTDTTKQPTQNNLNVKYPENSSLYLHLIITVLS